MKLNIYISLTIIFLLQNLAYGQNPIAAFHVNTDQNCSPVTVDFINQSTGNDLSYFWDLGNGNFSTLENPQAIYTEAGSYDVRLIVFNNQFSDTLSIENAIQVYSNPNIQLSEIGDYSGCTPFNREFSASTTNTDSVIFQWDFGNGHIMEGNQIDMNFTLPGEYGVLISAYSEHGCFSTFYKENVAKALPLPIIEISSNNNTFCNPNPLVEFELTSNCAIETALWNFGDSCNSSDTNPSHTYHNFGSFDVSCEVTDQHGCTNSQIIEDMIEISPVIAEFLPADSLICGSQTISFQNLSQAYSHVEWNFGDGATSYMVNPQHEYSNAGSYMVNLRVWNDDGCEDTQSHEITVEKITADFNVSDNSFCQLPALVQYISECENAVSWEYRLGNGNVFHTENPITLITDADMPLNNNAFASFTDTLIVTSQFGCTDTLIKANSIVINKPKAYFTPNNLPNFYNDVRGCVPFTVQFTEASVYSDFEDEIISTEWDFGDGNTTSENSPSHTWTEVGEYEVTLTITTETGCSSTYTAIIEVGSPQIANFSHSLPDTICASEYIQTFDESSDESVIDQWLWTYSDGGMSMTPNPSYHFTDTGYMDISLTVGYNGCMSEPFQVNDIVYVNGPVAEFTYDYDCENPLTYTFHSDLIEADTWYWELGDGYSGFENQESITYTYSEPGNYTAKIIAYNADNDCSYFYRRTLKPRDVKSILHIDNDSGCPGLTVNMDPHNSMYEIASEHNGEWGKFYWIIDDGLTDSVTNDAISYQFNTPGQHTIDLVISDRNGCQDTARQIVRIYGATGEVISNINSGCSPLEVEFQTNIISDTTIINWNWNFGDGLCGNTNSPTHLYTSGGSYSPQAVVTDAMGCQSILHSNDMIVSIQPNANFTTTDRYLCIGDSTSFIPSMNIPNASFNWEVESKAPTSIQTPAFQFNDPGFFDVTLHVVDTNGCHNQLTINDYISVESYPTANFTADTLSATCYPFEVSFQDLCESNITEWIWGFGDESVGSDIEIPSHNYIHPGSYDVSLIVSTQNGCRDSIVKEDYINVGGPWAEIIVPDSVCKGIEFEMHCENMQNIQSVVWDMGNGQLIEGTSVNYQYDTYGDYHPIILLQSDAINTCNKTFEKQIIVPEVRANFSINDEGICNGSILELVNNSIGTDTYNWTFGDDHDSDLFEPTHQYIGAGTYQINLYVERHLTNGSVCSDSLSNNLIVHPTPVSDFGFKISNPEICKTPKEVQFTNLSQGATSYLWHFDCDHRPDNAHSEETHPSYIYNTPGLKKIRLISINEFSCKDTSNNSLQINHPIYADFRISETEGCEPLTVEFEDISYIENQYDRIVNWDYQYTNGSNGIDKNSLATFANGIYGTTLIIESEFGCRDTIVKENAITVYRKPNAKFEIISNNNQENPLGYGEVRFMNYSGGGTSPYNSSWDFGDGQISEEINPVHKYRSNTDFLGEAFQPELILTDANGCSDTLTKSLTMDYFNGLFVPNAMMPTQGSGEQRVFKPKGKSLISYHLTIYDRNGNLIFESTDLDPADGSPTEYWDGQINGRYADEGVYVWKIDAMFSDGTEWNYQTKSGKKVNTGTLLVIR